MSSWEDKGNQPYTETIPTNLLKVYRPVEQDKLTLMERLSKPHTNILFVYDDADERTFYSVREVNALLTKREDPDGMKKRIVELIPRLLDYQKDLLALNISPEALNVVRAINPDTANLVVSWINNRVMKGMNTGL